jgi:hypothetical protein
MISDVASDGITTARDGAGWWGLIRRMSTANGAEPDEILLRLQSGSELLQLAKSPVEWAQVDVLGGRRAILRRRGPMARTVRARMPPLHCSPFAD